MHGNFYEDRGQANPRQAEVDRLRDAAARSLRASKASSTDASSATSTAGEGRGTDVEVQQRAPADER